MARRGRSNNMPRNPNHIPLNPEPVPAANNENGADFARTFMDTLQGFMQNQVIPPQQPYHVARPNDIVEQFRRMGPNRLKGNEGPIGTEEWIREMERIFGHLQCTEAQKVSCAIFQLAEEASYWWESRSRDMNPEDIRAITWEEFKEMLMNQYFPQSFRDQKET
jgi:hypothetical protein